MRRLVLASNNLKKLVELQALLEPVGVALVTQASLGLSEADEPYGTFFENALAKARHAALGARGAAIADDSGLCVAALGGMPGVLSARYATLFGEMKGDVENNAVLLKKMQGQRDRRARFVCVLVAVRHADDPEPLLAVGRWEGVLLEHGQGEQGFGYDPLFFVPALGCTAAQLDPQEKNRHSHRALAVGQMLALMRELW